MRLPPAVIVHGLADVRLALAPGRPVTLLSAPGAALYAGPAWWRALLGAAGPGPAEVVDILDCADGSGAALAALRVGQIRLVLWPEAPGAAAVRTVAEAQGGFVLPAAPPALDLGARGAERRLADWLLRATTGDKTAPFG